jgi:hypothetical protein
MTLLVSVVTLILIIAGRYISKQLLARIKAGGGFFATLEKYLETSDRRTWAAVVRTGAKFMTPDTQKKKQLEWIKTTVIMDRLLCRNLDA